MTRDAVGWTIAAMLLPLWLLIVAVLALPAAAEAGPKKRADLAVAKAVAGDSAVRLTVHNHGRAAAPPTKARLWLQTGGVRQRLADVRVRRLRPGTKATVTAAFAAPATPGTYRLRACADATRKLKERKEADNCRAAGAITVEEPVTPPPTPPPAGPDLAATDVSDPPGHVREGGSFTLADTVANAGHPAGASTTRFYLSPDSDASLAERRASGFALRDVVLGGARDVPPLAPGQTSSSGAPTLVTVPPGTRPGVYHVLACADDREALAEADEGDNCVAATHPEGGAERPSLIEVIAEEQEYRLETYSDVYDAEDVGDLDPTVCFDTGSGSFSDVGTAVASAQAFLQQRAPTAMAAFAASPEYDSALLAQEAAGAAIADDLPGAALAALLRAHELEPHEASHLVNAAPVAAGLGMPAEALAFLDEARRLDDTDLPAMGISRHAVALANRGHALALLGRWAEAERALAAALGAEPLLAEAQGSLAMVELCRGNPEAAAERARLAATRQGPRPLDATRGQASSLRNLEFPPFPEQAAAEADYWTSLNHQLGSEIIALGQREQPIDDRLNEKFGAWQPAQRKRYAGVIRRLAQAQNEPDIKSKREAMDAKLDEAHQDSFDFWVVRYQEILHEADEACEGSTNPDCFDIELDARCRPATRSAHQEWLDHQQEGYDLARAYFAALSTRMSGYAAHFSDPDAHAKAMIMIERAENAVLAHVDGTALLWTQFVWQHSDHCVEPFEPSTETPPGPPAALSEGECPALLSTFSAVLDVGVAKVKVSCESLKLELSAGPNPWIKLFGEVDYRFRQQTMTVVAGAKAEIAAGVAKGAFKSGLYVTVGHDGMRDVGWRVGPSLSVTQGPVEFKVKDEVDISFVGGVMPEQ